jgi:formylglycine-generating enzyme required for sulfatase activity
MVGNFPGNQFGLYDMHGNVWEWCEDSWHENYHHAPLDGSAWIDKNDDNRVVRGGAWKNYSWTCRSAYRDKRAVRGSYISIGFRVVCVQKF